MHKIPGRKNKNCIAFISANFPAFIKANSTKLIFFISTKTYAEPNYKITSSARIKQDIKAGNSYVKIVFVCAQIRLLRNPHQINKTRILIR